MKRTCLFSLLTALSGGVAMADDVAIPLLTVTDIQKSTEPVLFQGVQEASVGSIYFPDQILTFPARTAEGDGQKIIAQWSKSHRFVIIPISISVSAKDNFVPEAVDITVAFSGLGHLNQQPIVIDSFPATGFNPGAFQGSASLKLDGEAKFAPAASIVPVSPSVGAEVSAGLSYKYAPAYANVVSGFASAHAFWQFRKTQDNYPVGEIPIKLLVAIPNSYKKATTSLEFDVRVKFSGSWWAKGLAIATFSASAILPQNSK